MPDGGVGRSDSPGASSTGGGHAGRCRGALLARRGGGGNGALAQSRRTLERLDALGWGHALEPLDFGPWSASAEFQAVAKRIAAREVVVARSQPLFTLAERDFLPEGIAWDARTGTFFVGSLRHRKVVAFGADGVARDFISEARDGLWSVLGIKVDTARRHLWLASRAGTMGKDIPEAQRGHTGIFQYDLDSGALLRKVTWTGKLGEHLFNDLALHPNGDVYVSDTDAGQVHVLRAGSDALVPLVPPGTVVGANGLALSEDGARLYVADYRGLWWVDLASGRASPVQSPPGTTLGGIDGLIPQGEGGALVAIQNGLGRGRVLRLMLGSDPARVERVEVLETGNALFETPTTGVVAQGRFVYIANSHVREWVAEGHPPREPLSASQVLSLPLGGVDAAR
ncbi:SMP-30/gluconolactonase/LRE family protein [Myxococcaceae bacterium JPH2]|nr:SMP-30/gluconolactonase/LRE family protein [Myxococcaceae bacterium JPH2]